MVSAAVCAAPKRTWFCRWCGSQKVHHDATVVWNPARAGWDVVDVHEGMSCVDCMARSVAAGRTPFVGNCHSDDGRGDPVFGVPPALPAVAVAVAVAVASPAAQSPGSPS